jgi:hypothetical protein
MHPVTTRARRIWGLVGLAVAASFAIPGGWLIAFAGVHNGSAPQDTITRTVTVSQPVTTVNVQTSGAPVQVTAGPVHRVRVTEAIIYPPWDGGPPAVPQSVSGGILTLAQPACDCVVGFTVTIPPGVGVAADTESGPLTVSGAAGANLDSGGGPVRATGITGHLIISADGGTVQVNGLTGPLDANTGGGPLWAAGIDATTVTVLTGGGQAQIGFSTPPDGLFISTDGGPATLSVPGGPYALTANTYGGPEAVGIATDPAVGRSITVTTGGGRLQIEPSKDPGAATAAGP